MKTTVIRAARAVPARVGRTYDFVLDMHNDPKWAPLVEGVEQIEGKGPGEGASYTIQQRLGKKVRPQTITVVAAERPRRISWAMDTSLMSYESTMTFDPRGDTTNVQQENRYHWKPRAPWLVPLLWPILAPRNLRKQLVLLAQALA